MRVLLVRPIPPNERFGLGPFFRIESLGMEYIGAALESAGHSVRFADLRFDSLDRALADHSPEVCGVAAAHTLDTSAAIEVARLIKARSPRAFVMVGGHAAAVYPEPFLVDGVDAICVEDGERAVPELLHALANRLPISDCAGWVINDRGRAVRTPQSDERVDLDAVPRPARHLVAPHRRHFLCLDRAPVYLVETARGCPYRCSFCTIWRHVDRSYRVRAIPHVADDLNEVGDHVFIADDLFFHPKPRALELARHLRKRGIRKKWLLAQTRCDLVARNPALLETFRPIAQDFDLFFGFEAPTTAGLEGYSKDAGVDEIREAVAVCRRLKYGITGNFIVDPDWREDDFERLWEFVEKNQLHRSGFTVMTPLPGTPLFDQFRDRILETDWGRWDMAHLLWEPRLGRRRFFELYTECWRRTVLNAGGPKKPWWTWLKNVRVTQIPMMVQVLYNTQRLLDPEAYLRETFPLPSLAEGRG